MAPQQTEDEEKDENTNKTPMLANISATLLIVGLNEARQCEPATCKRKHDSHDEVEEIMRWGYQMQDERGPQWHSHAFIHQALVNVPVRCLHKHSLMTCQHINIRIT